MRAVALLLLLAACAHVRDRQPASVDVVAAGDSVVRLRYGPDDGEVARDVAAALERALPVAERWGSLLEPVVVTIHPTHAALEAAARREGYAWLRAWARRTSIDLQSPRTWSRGRPSDEALVQLLAHELTHCIMYQSASRDGRAAGQAIPVWFREGMATVTAGERFEAASSGARRRSRRGVLLAASESLVRSESGVVYATAHRAFRFLLDRYGEQRVRRLISSMGEGQGFSQAFELSVGVPVQQFEGDFERHDDGEG